MSGAEDIERQSLNVFRMEMLGAKVQAVTTGSATLKDATNEAIRTWAERAEDTFYIIGSAVGPHPYPKMVKEFQRIISTEARRQILEKEGRLPDAVVACVGGGSNSIGMFADFIDDKDVKLIGVEAGGLGIDTGNHASAMALGEPGVLHGMKSYLLQDEAGNIKLAHSISAGLDYPGVGPEHAYLRDSGRAEYVSITDAECMDALMELCRMEGIIPAIESAHALAHVFKMAQGEYKGKIIVMCLSGRGDKDVHTVKVEIHKCFFLPENADEFPFEDYDYIVDAVDTVTAKLELVMKAKEKGVPIISSMGAGNKLDPTMFRVADIYKTKVCPLAKVMRRELKKRGVKKLKVVYSEEQPTRPINDMAISCRNHCICPPGAAHKCTERRDIPGSTAFVPSVVGLIIAGEVIKDLTKDVIVKAEE